MLFAVSLVLLFAGISASEAETICKAAIWSSRNTFIRHYRNDPAALTTVAFGRTVISVGSSAYRSREVYGVNDAEDIFSWVDNKWKQVPGKLIHVSVGPAGVWGVNRANTIFKFQDNAWLPISGALKQVDAGGDKFLGGVNAQDNIFCLRQSCTVSRSSAVSFTPLEGSLKYYSCGPVGCWGVNSGNSIYFRHNVNPTACQGNQWQHIEGSLVMIEVGTDGSVYGVNSAGNVYRREGISAKTPIGTSWTQLDFCATFKHVTYDNGYLWLINPSGGIYRCAVN
ncbi:PREDICTED: fish-egg lectin-like, partial [Nanorana parkeri]|uniref:fish-egg lectin-like n=1 Tax=Nanorana parkeri TaxID=125878 RepID=UPI000854B1B7